MVHLWHKRNYWSPGASQGTWIYKYANKLISKDKISKAKKVPTSYQLSVLSGTLWYSLVLSSAHGVLTAI